MRLRLVVPIDVDSPTGGNVYDLAVADALQRTGDDVQLMRCDASALSDVLRQPWPGHTLVDGLLACPAPQIVASARVGVLVHMPLALESGLPSDRAAQLDELERQALHAATKVVTTSHWSAHYLEQHHGVHGVAVAQPGVEPALLGEGSDPPLLVQLATVLPHKDQLGVVAALTQVSDLAWRARLAGSIDRDPGYAAAVREAVDAAGLTARVEIAGVMDRDAAWAGADLALLPSRVEAFGMVVTEALARGVPAIVSEGGAAEALGVTTAGERPGVVVPAGDADALARELRRWMTDAQYRNDLRVRALSRRRTLDRWETTAHSIRLALSGA